MTCCHRSISEKNPFTEEMTFYDNTTIRNPSIVKGGEKRMTCEWENLEKLSKEDLIIELVKYKWALHNLCETLHYIADIDAGGFLCAEGYKPSKKWAEKILAYAKEHVSEGEYVDLTDYGVDLETCDEYEEHYLHVSYPGDAE